MGVRGLLSYCHSIQTKVHISKRAPSSIGIDAYSLFYHVKDDLTRAKELLEAFLSAGHTITLVVDRRANSKKTETVVRRGEIRAAAAADAETLEEIMHSESFELLSSQEKRVLERSLEQKKKSAWHFTAALLQIYKDMCSSLGVIVELAKEEADTALAQGCQEGRWSIVVSGDSDLLLLRVPRLWMLTGKNGVVKEIDYQEFLRYMCLTPDQILGLALLAGSDTSPRPLMRIEQAVSWLRYYGSLERIHSKYPDKVTCEDMLRWKDLQDVYTLTES